MMRSGQGQVAGWGQLMSRLAPSFAGMFGGGGGLQDLLGGPQQQQDPFGRARTSPGYGTNQHVGIGRGDDWNSGRGFPEWWTAGGSPDEIPGWNGGGDPGTGGIGEVQRMGLPFGKSIDPRWASVIAAGLGPVIGSFGSTKEQELERERFEFEQEKYAKSQSPWAGHFASAMMGLEPSNLTQSVQPTLQQDLQDLSGEDRVRRAPRNRFRYGGQFRRNYGEPGF
jgi:hypothetical protein